MENHTKLEHLQAAINYIEIACCELIKIDDIVFTAIYYQLIIAESALKHQESIIESDILDEQ
ncbi:hypothetical protein ELBI_68 [Anabaena phage Elbi]|nr:hypothetical protein ELBI_68 [Anabaena phage Elbi]